MSFLCGVCGKEIQPHERQYLEVGGLERLEAEGLPEEQKRVLLPHAKCMELKKAEMKKYDEEHGPNRNKKKT